jgi:hypothetical protein
MEFRTQDLNITVLPKRGAAVYLAKDAAEGFAPCPRASMMFCPHTQYAWMLTDREDLVALRIQLQDALEQLEKLEPTLPSRVLAPAEADALEQGLNETIEQVRQKREGLK